MALLAAGALLPWVALARDDDRETMLRRIPSGRLRPNALLQYRNAPRTRPALAGEDYRLPIPRDGRITPRDRADVYMAAESALGDEPLLVPPGVPEEARSSPLAPATRDRYAPYRGPRTAQGADGYFPTQTEWKKLGQYYPRAVGDLPGGEENDPRTQAPSGLFPYPALGLNNYQDRPSLLPAADPYLGLFVPQGGGGFDLPGRNLASGGDVRFQAELPFLTRAFNPERATFKLGLAYLDVLSVSGAVLFNDFDGPQNFRRNEGDGVLAAVSTQLRLFVPLTPSTYLSAAGSLFYLPISNRVGFSLTDPISDSFNNGLRLVYEERLGKWWLNFTNDLAVVNRLGDVLDNLSAEEIEASGRYRFGREAAEDRRPTGFFDNDQLLLSNRASLTGVGLLSPIWRLTTELARQDVWELNNFEHRPSSTRLSAQVDYYGQNWRFAPFAGVNSTAYGQFDQLRHEVFVGVSGPLTQFLRVFARGGYTFATGQGRGPSGPLAEVGFTHEISPYTRQSLVLALNVQEASRFGENNLGSLVRYTFEQRFNHRVVGSFFAQGATTNSLDDDGSANIFTSGFRLSANLTDYTSFTLAPVYDVIDRDNGRSEQRLILRALVTHTFLPGLFGSLLYQYENANFDDELEGFQEHLLLLSLTQQF